MGFDQLDPRILPEMGVRVNFLSDPASASDRETVVIPRRALRKSDGRDSVLVVEEDRVEERAIQVGELRNEEASVTEGLQPGDRVVVDGPDNLRPGMRIREKAS